MCVCVCVCVCCGGRHIEYRESHTNTRTGYTNDIFPWKNDIVPLNSWYHRVSLPNKLIAYLLLVHRNASTRGSSSMMPRFPDNERECTIIGIIECTVTLVS
jgi:hypothetical protein